MTADKLQQLAALTTRLAESLMTAAICANEIRVMVRADLESPTARGRTRPPDLRPGHPRRPLVDASSLSVLWAGKTCPLRHTILFRLAECLARHPDQYIAADQLVRNVWDDGVKSPDTIRSAIRRLRQRFTDAGMDDLAVAIRGTGGRYGLILTTPD